MCIFYIIDKYYYKIVCFHNDCINKLEMNTLSHTNIYNFFFEFQSTHSDEIFLSLYQNINKF